MPVFEGTAVTNQAVVRKSPATGIKIGALRAGASIKGDRLADGSDRISYLHIVEPLDGWVLASDLSYKKSVIPEPEPIRADAVATVISGDPSNIADAEERAALELARELASSGRKALPEELASLAKYKIFMVRKWGDPIMKKYSFTLQAFKENLGSNFQPVPLYDAQGNGAGVLNFVLIDKAQIAHLKSLQINDGFPPEKKMQWFAADRRGRPYMWDNDKTDWKKAQVLRWQAIVYGGQPVIVLDTRDIVKLKLPGQPKRTVTMARILLYNMDDPDERAIQNATAVRGHLKDDYVPKPNGMIIRAPIWQGKFQFIPVEWLEK